MNREIKFRIWGNKRKRFWGWSDLCNIGTEQDGILDLNKNIEKQSYYQGLNPTEENYTIQQFTGLKDRNGKEVYEGDILENEKFGGIFQIIFGIPNESYCGFCIHWIKKHSNSTEYDLLYYKNYENCKVIGNIFETPQLLN